MVVNIISLIMLVIPPAITSESSWTSPDVRIATEWSLNVIDLINPLELDIGTVYSAESEEGFEWNTVLVDKNFVLLLEGDTVVNTIPYSGDIWVIVFSPDRRYMLGRCSHDEKLLLFDLEESTVKSIPLFSREIGLGGGPLIRVTNDGTVLVKQSTYLRMYDSNFNCILSRDDFSWGRNVGLSNAGDRMYSTTYDSLRAYDMQGNLLWNIELFEQHEFWQLSIRDFLISNDGSYVVITDFDKLQVIRTADGTQCARFDLPEHIDHPIFTESDSKLALCYVTDTTVGAITISVFDDMFELEDYIEISSSRAERDMPVSLRVLSISENGYTLGYFPFEYPSVYVKCVLFNRNNEIVWLSNSITPSLNRFIGSLCGLRDDGSGFWYFDGTSLHSCLIEGIN